MPTWHKHYMAQATGAHIAEALAQEGAVLQVEVNLPQPLIDYFSRQNQPVPAPLTGSALIDTGASKTCVDETILTRLGINATGLISLGTAGGRTQRTLHPVKLAFPEFGFVVETGSVVSVDLGGQIAVGLPLIALVGRDILRYGHFFYAGSGAFFTLSF